MRSASNLSLKRSRITPLTSLASRCTAAGGLEESARRWIFCHISCRRLNSASSVFCVTSSLTVRTMMPPESFGRTSRAILRSFERWSRPSILRLTPTWEE